MEKLDKFYPDDEEVNSVKRQILNAGIGDEYIPMDWLTVILAATKKYLNTVEGLKKYLISQKFDISPGESDKEYFYYNGEKDVRVNHKKVYFLSGIIMDGKMVALEDTSEVDIDSDRCDSCGISSHCVDVIRNPETDKMETLCNVCRMLHNNVKVQATADSTACTECTVSRCYHKRSLGV